MDFDEEAFRAIMSVMTRREGEIVSTALIRNSVDGQSEELRKPIKQLIMLGELTLIYVQQSGRVILNKSVHPDGEMQMTLSGENGVWRCYIAEDHKERYHSGLFKSKDSAKEFLWTRVGDRVGNLKRVPVVENVYATEITGFEGYGSHTVVIRGEKINRHLSLKE